MPLPEQFAPHPTIVPLEDFVTGNCSLLPQRFVDGLADGLEPYSVRSVRCSVSGGNDKVLLRLGMATLAVTSLATLRSLDMRELYARGHAKGVELRRKTQAH